MKVFEYRILRKDKDGNPYTISSGSEVLAKDERSARDSIVLGNASLFKDHSVDDYDILIRPFL